MWGTGVNCWVNCLSTSEECHDVHGIYGLFSFSLREFEKSGVFEGNNIHLISHFSQDNVTIWLFVHCWECIEKNNFHTYYFIDFAKVVKSLEVTKIFGYHVY